MKKNRRSSRLGANQQPVSMPKFWPTVTLTNKVRDKQSHGNRFDNSWPFTACPESFLFFCIRYFLVGHTSSIPISLSFPKFLYFLVELPVFVGWILIFVSEIPTFCCFHLGFISIVAFFNLLLVKISKFLLLSPCFYLHVVKNLPPISIFLQLVSLFLPPHSKFSTWGFLK